MLFNAAKFLVNLREVRDTAYEVEADGPDKALKEVKRGKKSANKISVNKDNVTTVTALSQRD